MTERQRADFDAKRFRRALPTKPLWRFAAAAITSVRIARDAIRTQFE